LPEFTGHGSWQKNGGLLQVPQAVVPDPVALGILSQKGEEKLKVGLDETFNFFLAIV
jgi:hypothetical protein